MDYALFLSDPERLLAPPDKVDLARLAALLAAFCIAFGIVEAADMYVIAHNQVKIMIAVGESVASLGNEAAAKAGLTGGMGAYVEDAAAASGLATAIWRAVAAAVLTVSVYFLMRWQGSKAGFADVFRPAVCFLAVPLTVSCVSAALNVVSYEVWGLVPVMNTALPPAAGWIAYYVYLGIRVRKISGLSGLRGDVALLPLALLIIGNLITAAAIAWWPVFVNSEAEYALAGVLG
jgi:hypothetical protein